MATNVGMFFDPSSPLTYSATGNYLNDILLTMGTGGDIAFVDRSTALALNTALTNVIIGTPVTPAVAADSLILSNTTSNGDILIVVNNGGNSTGMLKFTGSGATATAYQAWTFSASGTALTVTNNATISGTATVGTLAATTINGAALSGTFTGAPTLSGTVAFTAANSFTVANAQTLTISIAAQTVGAATLTVPNFAGVADTLAFITLAQTLSNKTLSAPVFSGAYSFGGTPTFGGTMAGASTFSGAITLSAAATALTVTNAASIASNVLNSSGLDFAGGAGRIRSASNENLTLLAQGTGNLIFNTDGSTQWTIDAGTLISAGGNRIQFTGSTSGVVTLGVAAAAGTWTMLLPTAVGTAGQQLTDGAGDGVTSWAAAGSRKEWKYLKRLWDMPQEALARIVGTPVWDFQYKPSGQVTTGDFETLYTGILAQDAPWAMHFGGNIINPVNTLGYMVLGFQAVVQRLNRLEQQFAERTN